LEWFKQQGHTIPEPSAAGIGYASFLEELSEKEPQAFITHFYNLYFGHSAGGVLIGKKVTTLPTVLQENFNMIIYMEVCNYCMLWSTTDF
jgi:heme oxygenase